MHGGCSYEGSFDLSAVSAKACWYCSHLAKVSYHHSGGFNFQGIALNSPLHSFIFFSAFPSLRQRFPIHAGNPTEGVNPVHSVAQNYCNSADQGETSIHLGRAA